MTDLRRWMDRADVDDGVKAGPTGAARKELAELRRRDRVLKMENEILQRLRARAGGRDC